MNKRTLYKAIRLLEKTNNQLSDCLVRLKRLSRQKTKRNCQMLFVVNDGADGWCEKYRFSRNFSQAEKRAYILDNWIFRQSSDYDCTGQVFTERIEIFDVPSGTIVYHFKSVDV